MEYRREIDGLRALAVIPVILFHAGFSLFSGGFVGVDIFFVISGFLITSIIIKEREVGNFSLARFYQRRIRRILPALFFVIACCLPFAWVWMLPTELEDFSKSLASIPLFLSNYYFRLDTGYFAAAADEKPLLHTWSLAVEEQYYLLFPALVSILWTWRKKWIVPLLTICALVSFGYAVWHVQIDNEKLFFDTRGRAWEILSGSLVAFYSQRRSLAPPSLLLQQVLSSVGLLLILVSIFTFDETVHFPSAATLLPIAGTILVLLFARPHTLAGRVLSSKALVGIGLISYSAYLWHQPLLALARVYTENNVTTPALMALCALTLGLAYLSWRFIEQPCRTPGNLSNKAMVQAAVCASVALFALGMTGAHFEGFHSRFQGQQIAFKETYEREQTTRTQLTRQGACHRASVDRSRELTEFLAQWQCDTDPSLPNLQRIPVVVVGDSHAADIVMALKMNGYLPLQMTGSGCSVMPRSMSKACRAQFDHVRRFVSHNDFYTDIVLANRFNKGEMTPKKVQSMIEYWSLPHKHLRFVTSMPEFRAYERSLVLGRTPTADFSRSDFSSTPEALKMLRERGVSIISSREAFCSLTRRCTAFDEGGAPLTIDGHHLTAHGGKLLGNYIIQRGLLPLPVTGK